MGIRCIYRLEGTMGSFSHKTNGLFFSFQSRSSPAAVGVDIRVCVCECGHVCDI